MVSFVSESRAKSVAAFGNEMKYAQPGAHPARTRVRRRVELAIGLGNGSRLVCGEVVPIVLEVGALAACHQRFGRGTIETEMPVCRVVVDRLPARNSGQKHIHQHELLGLRRKLRGVRVGHHQPDVVTDDRGLFDAQRPDEVVDANGRARHVKSVGGDVGVTDPREIRRNHRVMLRQSRDERTPHARRLRVAVQQYDRGALPRCEVLQLHATNVSRSNRDR